MRIKYSYSDEALRSLWTLISFIRHRFIKCLHQGHNTVVILYISSLIVTPVVTYKGRRLLKEIHNLANLSPTNFICVFRTTAPSYFKRRSTMEKLQKKSIELLRDSCYVVVYDPHREFLNHAKFFVFYHICFSKGKIYHGKYYGSTNLTTVGLAYNRKHGIGNYEEYTVIGPMFKFLSKSDTFYLKEVLELINHKVSLYTDPYYLRSYVMDHLSWLETISKHSHRVNLGTTLGELYEAYTNLLIAHNQTYALLDELPGKKLVRKLVDTMVEVSPPIDPFELEMMIPIHTDDSELLARDLGFSSVKLKSLITKYIEITEKSHELIEEKYLPKLKEINQYLDNRERRFVRFIKENSKYHRNTIKKLVSKAYSSEMA